MVRESVDLLIEARWLLPMEPADRVLERHSVAVRGGRICALLPWQEAETRFEARERLRLHTHALLPGLVNLHTHAAMTLLRGLADDLPLMEWLQKHIWPAEMRFVTPEFVYDGTLLACAEMIRGGVTCFNDMYFFPEAAAKAALEAGMRAAIGMIVVDFPTPYAADPDDYLTKGMALRDQYRSNSLLSFCMAPHAPYTVSDKTFGKMLTYAAQIQVPIHVHLHETEEEIRESLRQHGVRPIERLRRLGLLGPDLVAVHMVHLTPEEVDLVACANASVVHCPSSNLKLASGFSPVAELMEHGVNVGLGTDGAASNNRLDVFQELRTAALLAKAVSGRANALPAHRVLQMATLNGARALGLENETGSLLPGKSADMVAVNLGTLELSPCYDPHSHLVYAAGREHVSHVWVQGRLLLNEGRLTRLDVDEIIARATRWGRRVAEADGSAPEGRGQ
ncbi:TRZ/ATZ family hydrolase [Pelomicrobium methylotrophicum]|uniref:5-methylthioadenosine/S-adenosylhomocysteine deaminase n=1 Tax=Pelomicrobium methylotrophicum TaxID=2602750 RepID=A0A5C7EVQ8_9PROT|nr:TRZ/ATZ family hydrolase [Pelomicrobium methylotrophicum]TXF12437.1 TRZ/ATZ family hydrolase [Pelomicrobium methylotrophicum]